MRLEPGLPTKVALLLQNFLTGGLRKPKLLYSAAKNERKSFSCYMMAYRRGKIEGSQILISLHHIRRLNSVVGITTIGIFFTAGSDGDDRLLPDLRLLFGDQLITCNLSQLATRLGEMIINVAYPRSPWTFPMAVHQGLYFLTKN
jgi:hypothetical protein